MLVTNCLTIIALPLSVREFTRMTLTVSRDEARFYSCQSLKRRTEAANHMAKVMHLRLQQKRGCEITTEFMRTHCAILKVPSLGNTADTIALFRMSGSWEP